MKYILLATLVLNDVSKLWDKYYKQYFKKYDTHNQMTKPPFRWLKRMTNFHRLGHYRYKYSSFEKTILERELALNPRLVENLEVLEKTLIHEMCHQAVAEIDHYYGNEQNGHHWIWENWMNRCGIANPARYSDSKLMDMLRTDTEKEEREKEKAKNKKLVENYNKHKDDAKNTRKNLKPKDIQENTAALLLTTDGLVRGVFVYKKSVKWAFVPVNESKNYYLIKVTKDNVFEATDNEKRDIYLSVDRDFIARVKQYEMFKSLGRKLNKGVKMEKQNNLIKAAIDSKLVGPVSDFKKRTEYHISLVFHYGKILAEHLDKNADYVQLLEDLRHHDESKFSEDEKKGYIWINAHYNLGYEYPSKEVEQMAEKAWKHHYTNNNHHPEFWKDCNDMPKYVIAHMIADWKAMEFINDNSTKINDFWEKVASKKYKWDDKHIKWIKEFIEVLTNED